MDKIIIVGSGFSGSVLAREIAENLNRKVLLIEKRNHIGGNAYDEKDKYGIIIQKYGPHYITTNNYDIIEYLSRFAELIPHDVALLSYIDNNYVQLPFNFKTMQQLAGYKNSEILLSKMRKYFLGRDRVPILELVNHKDEYIKEYGELLFEKAYKTYIAKQWGLNPEEIDKSVLERVPMAMSFDNRYINKDFQYLPKLGFKEIFKNMLNHPNIEVELNINPLCDIQFDSSSNTICYKGEEIELLVYTGAIDELFNCKYGQLPYRSLNITYDYYKEDSVLPCEIISYPQANGYTRKTEYKKINFDCSTEYSVVATEYPLEYDPKSKNANIPYYPTLTKQSQELYQLYLNESRQYHNLVLCGRLAEFKYFNMDTCIEHALDKFKEIKEYLEGSK